MRLLISGAAGFLGSHLSEYFLRQGHEVVGVDNLCTGSEDNVEILGKFENFTFIRADVTAGFEANARFDRVVHFASPASPPDYQKLPLETYWINTQGTENMLKIAERDKARFMFASTSEIYGNPEIHPQPETYRGNVSPNGDRSMYDEGKRGGETITAIYRRDHGVDARVIRIFNTYGPRLRPGDGRVVSNFIVQALSSLPLTVYGDGSQTRSLCYVSDEIEGVVSFLEYEYESEIDGFDSDFYTVNIGNPAEVTVLELAETVNRLFNPEGTITYHDLPPHDPERRQPDISKINSLTGWKPKVDLEQGLKLTAEFFRTQL
jgi:nucleoside-diphosphate-sugar epimerase